MNSFRIAVVVINNGGRLLLFCCGRHLYLWLFVVVVVAHIKNEYAKSHTQIQQESLSNRERLRHGYRETG